MTVTRFSVSALQRLVSVWVHELLKWIDFYENFTFFFFFFFVKAYISWLLRKRSKCEANFAPVVKNQKAIHKTRSFPVRSDACYDTNMDPLSFSAPGCSGAIKSHRSSLSEWYWLEISSAGFPALPCCCSGTCQGRCSGFSLIIHSKCFPSSFLVSFGDEGLLVSRVSWHLQQNRFGLL